MERFRARPGTDRTHGKGCQRAFTVQIGALSMTRSTSPFERNTLAAAAFGWLSLVACSGEDPKSANTPAAQDGGSSIGTTTGGVGGSATDAVATASNTSGQAASSTSGAATSAAPTTTTDGSATGSTTTGSATTGMATVTGSGGASGTTTGATTGVGGTGGTEMGSTVTTTTGAGGTTMIPDDGDRSIEGTCARWNADTADMSEGTWSGNLASCDAGDISADGRENALRLFNLYRWLADLPSVTTEAERNQQAQECALMMDANNSLSHDPPTSWTCYSETGAQGASTSNISSGPGVSSVALYMVDGGNESTFGHRRIILSNWLGPIGLGSTGDGGASCMQNIGGTGDAGKEWVAWPPGGVFPIQAYGNMWSTLADTGWSVQSEDIDLSGSQVTVTAGGEELSVTTTPLTGNYGSTNGIRINLNGWDVQAGETYSVSVSGTSIAYDVVVVDCDQY